MPAPKKPVDRLQRRNKPKAPDLRIVAMNTEDVPSPPKGISKLLKDEWSEIWQSPLAAYWDRSSDLRPLRRLFSLYDKLAKFERVGLKDPLSRGSTGQRILHPMLKEADEMRKQILALEQQFGMTPMARLKLGIALGEAAKSLEQLNADLFDDDDGADADEVDPRSGAIDTSVV